MLKRLIEHSAKAKTDFQKQANRLFRNNHIRLVVFFIGLIAFAGIATWLVWQKKQVAKAVTITATNVPPNNEYFTDGFGVDYITQWNESTDVIIDNAVVEINFPVTVRNLTLRNNATLKHAPALGSGKIPLGRDNFAVKWSGQVEVLCNRANPVNCDANNRNHFDVKKVCVVEERSGRVQLELKRPDTGEILVNKPTQQWNVLPKYYGSNPARMNLICVDTVNVFGNYRITIKYDHRPGPQQDGTGFGGQSPAYMSVVLNVTCEAPAGGPPGPCTDWRTTSPARYLKTLAGDDGLVAEYYAFGSTIPYEGLNNRYPANSVLKATRIDKFDIAPSALFNIIGGDFFGYFWGQAGPWDILAKNPNDIGIRVMDTFSIDASSKIDVDFKGYPGGLLGYVASGNIQFDLSNPPPDLVGGDPIIGQWVAKGYIGGAESSAGFNTARCAGSLHDGGGGGYGGVGGQAGPNNGRNIPDDPTISSWIGGGGDYSFCPGVGGGADDAAQGADGGGKVAIIAQTMRIDAGARIFARGGVGGDIFLHGDVSAGGGAGGGVCLSADTINFTFGGGSGTSRVVNVSGGDTTPRRDGDRGGGGAGGRVAISALSIQIDGINVNASYSSAPGSGIGAFSNAGKNVEIAALGGDQGTPAPNRGGNGTIVYQNSVAPCPGVPALPAPTTGTITKSFTIPLGSRDTGDATNTILRTTKLDGVVSGGRIDYTVTVNVTSATGATLTIEDTFPAATQYVGNGNLNGTPSAGAACGSFWCWNILGPPANVPTTYTLTFSLDYRPLNFASCTDVSNTVRLLEGANEVVKLDTDPVAVGFQPLITKTECFELEKEVNTNISNPSSGWVKNILAPAGVDLGQELLFRFNFRTSGSVTPYPAWVIDDLPQAGKYDTSNARAAVDAAFGGLTGKPVTYAPSLDRITFYNLENFSGQQIAGDPEPGAPHRLTFVLKVKDNACDTVSRLADNVWITYGGVSGRVPIALACRIVVTGDVGGGTGNINVDTFKVTGPAVIVARGSVIASPVQENINPNVRRLADYTFSITTWISQFNKIKERLIKEFAKTGASGWLRVGGSYDLTPSSTNPLGIWKYDICTPCSNRKFAENAALSFTSSSSRSATIIISGDPPGGTKVEIDNNINATVPVALIFDTNKTIAITSNGSSPNRTLTNIALIAPNATIDFSASAPRSITFNGLIIANQVIGLSDPDNYGSIKFDKSIITNPPPGLAQFLGVIPAEQAP